MKRSLLLILVLLCSLSAWCQYAGVSATLTDGSGSFVPSAYLHFSLRGCGANFPVVTGNSFTPVKASFELKPNPVTGIVSGVVVGNDQILCGNVAPTFYEVAMMRDAVTAFTPPMPFIIAAGSTWTPASQPMSNPPGTAGFSYIFGNPTGSQSIIQPATGASGTVSVTILGGAINTCSVGAAGTGYASPPALVITGGGGNGALLYATVANGALSGCVVVAGGTLYSTLPSVAVVGGTSLSVTGVLDLSAANVILPGAASINFAAGGANQQVQYNNNNALGGNANFTFNPTTKNVSMASYNQIFVLGTPLYPTIKSGNLAAVAAGGGLLVTPVGYTETITNSTKTDLGDGTHPVFLKLSPGTVITIDVRDGTYALGVRNGSGIVAEGSNSTRFLTAATAIYKTIIETPDGLVGGPGQAYATLTNLDFQGNAGATCQEIVNLEGVSDLNVVTNLHIDTAPCILLRIASNATNVAGPIVLVNPELNGTYVAGARPLVVQVVSHSIVGISLLGGNITHPGSGLAIAEFNGGGTTGLQGVAISDATYIENLQNGTSIGVKLADVQNVHIGALGSKMQATDTFIDISETGGAGSGRTCNLNFVGLSIGSAGNAAPAIVNHISGEPNTGGAHVPIYTYGGDTSCSAGAGVTISSSPMQLLDRSGNVNYNFTVGGNSVFRNWLDQGISLALDSGATVPENTDVYFRDRGTIKWFWRKDTGVPADFLLFDNVNSVSRLFFPAVANVSTTGLLRAANNEAGPCWRSNAASDLCLKFDASNIFNVPSVTGFGAGAAGTAVTTSTKAAGTGPTTPQTVVQYMEVNVGGTVYWIPLVQ